MGSVRVVKGGMLASASLLSNFVFIYSLLYYFEVLLIKHNHNYIYTILLPLLLLILLLTCTCHYPNPTLILLSLFLLYSSLPHLFFLLSSSRRLAPKHFHLSPHKKCLGAQTECPVGRRILSKACNQSHQELPRYANYATYI